MMKTATKLAVPATLAAIGAATTMLWFRGLSQSPPPQTPEEKALATARAFIETAAVPVQPTAEVRVQRRSYEVLGERPWVVTWGGGGQAEVEVDGTGEYVTMFTNDWRIMQQVKRMERTGRSIFLNEDEAKAFVLKLAKALGVPEAARLEVFGFHGDDTPGRGDANRAGAVAASFRLDAHGYPFVTPGGPGAMIEVDPQDGVLVRYWASYDHVEMPDAPAPPRLAKSEAERLATGPYLKHRRPVFRRANAPTNAKLGWIVPNPSYGSGHPWSTVRPKRVRLAWVVYFGADAVFIDPYDGSVLGGLEMKGVKQNPPADLAGRTGRVRRLK